MSGSVHPSSSVSSAITVYDNSGGPETAEYDGRPTLEEVAAAYLLNNSQVHRAMREALCDVSCQSTLQHNELLNQCIILSWEMQRLNCRFNVQTVFFKIIITLTTPDH